MPTKKWAELVERMLVKNAPGCPERARDPNALLVDDLGFDSLDLCELDIDISEATNETPSEEQMDALRTVGDVIALCEKLTAGAKP